MESDQKKLTTNAELIARMRFASLLGRGYSGKRDMYDALGYDKELTYGDYLSQFSRQDIAWAVVSRPVNATWRGPVVIMESSDDQVTALEKAWLEMDKELKLKNKLVRLDKLTGIGRYGVLLLGFDDIGEVEDYVKPLEKTGKRKLIYVKPLSEDSAKINELVKDPKDPRYGKPLNYDVTLTLPGGGTTNNFVVHYSRVLHVVEDALEDDTEGTPRLQTVFNRLKDLEKIVGGSAEMFWRGARPGYAGKVDPEYEMGSEEQEQLQEQIDQYEHDLRRLFVNQGVTLESLAQQVADPLSSVEVQIQMISAATGIPKRILVGSERGELASSQDQNEWFSFIQTRREEFAEAQILRPLIDLLIEYKVLPEAGIEGYAIKWMDLFSVSEKDRAEVGRTRAGALKEYASDPMIESVVPRKAFFEFFLGLTDEQITLIEEMTEAEMAEDGAFDEEEEIEGPTGPTGPTEEEDDE